MPTEYPSVSSAKNDVQSVLDRWANSDPEDATYYALDPGTCSDFYNPSPRPTAGASVGAAAAAWTVAAAAGGLVAVAALAQ